MTVPTASPHGPWHAGEIVAACLTAGTAAAGCNALWGIDELSFDGTPVTTTDAGGGGATACEPGAVEGCYTGPAGTEGVGICQAGEQICAADGSGFGECQGEVVPELESCSTEADDDCDGFRCGETRWALRFGGTGDEGAMALASDVEGNVIVTGCYQTNTDFGGGLLPNPTSGSGSAGFVAKLSPAGQHVYSFAFGSGGSTCGTDVAVDDGGNAYVTARFSEPVQLDIGVISPRGGVDSLLVKISPTGSHEWAQHIGGPGGDYAFGVAWGAGGRLVVTGTFEDTVDFGGGPLTSGGAGDLFLVRYDADGNHVFSNRWGGAGQDSGRSVVLDPDGESVVAGPYEGSLSIGGEALPAAAGADGFIARFGADGTPEWAQAWGGSGADRLLDVAMTDDEQAVVVGRFESDLVLGDNGPSLTATGGVDGLVAWVDSSGALVRHLQLGPAEDQEASSVAVGPGGAISVAGYFIDSIDIAGQQLSGAAGSNVFVARLGSDGTVEHLGAFDQNLSAPTPQGFFAGWRDAAVDPAGNLLVATYINGDLDVGSETLELAGGTDGVVIQLSH